MMLKPHSGPIRASTSTATRCRRFDARENPQLVTDSCNGGIADPQRPSDGRQRPASNQLLSPPTTPSQRHPGQPAEEPIKSITASASRPQAQFRLRVIRVRHRLRRHDRALRPCIRSPAAAEIADRRSGPKSRKTYLVLTVGLPRTCSLITARAASVVVVKRNVRDRRTWMG